MLKLITVFLLAYHQRLFENEYKPKQGSEYRRPDFTVNDTNVNEELEEQLTIKLTKKESFKEIFTFDKLQLMMERINEQ